MRHRLQLPLPVLREGWGQGRQAEELGVKLSLGNGVGIVLL